MSNKYYLFTNQLTEEEHRVIVSIVKHIENGARRVGIQQIADENFVSTSFIMKLCKRLGFGGYSELFYSLFAARKRGRAPGAADGAAGAGG